MPKNPLRKPATKRRPVTVPSNLAFQRILVPIDFSEISISALKCALGFAEKLGASVHLLNVYEPPPFMAGYHTLPIAIPDNEVIQKIRTDLDALILRDLPNNVKVESFVRKGKPYVEIVKVAEEQNIDLIIISTHGYTGLKHTFLGSTAERVVRHALCPVLVIR